MDGALSSSFFNIALYRNIDELDGFPVTAEPIWILGIKYNATRDQRRLEEDIRSRILFTYRKGFEAIGSSGLTSDVGWGCMLRCGQMMLAQALVNRHLTRGWRWKQGKYDPKYFEILRLFRDEKDCCYSIHKIAHMGTLDGLAIGDWFGPNTVMQVLRKLVGYDRWSGLVIHVAMDNTVLINDIRELCRVAESDQGQFVQACNVPSIILSAYLSALQQQQQSTSHSAAGIGQSQAGCHVREMTGSDTISATNAHLATGVQCTDGKPATQAWRPLLLIVPLRLGLSKISEIYYNALKTCFTFRQSVGIIGGKPGHAHWFIGCTEDKLFYLDPHICQPFADVGRDGSDVSYHSKEISCMEMMQLDPSIAVGFYCDSEEDFDNLCRSLKQSFVCGGTSSPLFELIDVCHSNPTMATESESASANSSRPLSETPDALKMNMKYCENSFPASSRVTVSVNLRPVGAAACDNLIESLPYDDTSRQKKS